MCIRDSHYILTASLSLGTKVGSITEHFGKRNVSIDPVSYTHLIGLDEEVAKYISSANVACGFHDSDPVVMDKTVKILKENNVNLGAHPGYPDLMGFGRRNMNVSPADANAYVMYQRCV